MSVHDVQPAVGSPSVPRPRHPGQDADADHLAVAEPAGADGSARRPAQPRRSEPRTTDGTRPRTEYWDVTTARWRSRR